jgi:hypothetical protein
MTFPFPFVHPIRRIGSQALISQGAGTAFANDVGTTVSAAFDGNNDQARAASAICEADTTPFFLGKDYGAGNAKIITGVKAWGSNDQGFYQNNNPTVPLIVRASNTAAPTNTTEASGDGTQLASINGGTDANSLLISKLDIVNASAYRYVWIYLAAGASNGMQVAELEFYETPLTF